MRYVFNVIELFLQQKITWQTLRYALRERPIAVAGQRGAYITEARLAELLGIAS